GELAGVQERTSPASGLGSYGENAMFDSGREKERQAGSSLERLRRNAIIVVVSCFGLLLAVSLLRQTQLSQRTSPDDDRQLASDGQQEDGLGSPSYKPSPPAPLPSTG